MSKVLKNPFPKSLCICHSHFTKWSSRSLYGMITATRSTEMQSVGWLHPSLIFNLVINASISLHVGLNAIGGLRNPSRSDELYGQGSFGSRSGTSGSILMMGSAPLSYCDVVFVVLVSVCVVGELTGKLPVSWTPSVEMLSADVSRFGWISADVCEFPNSLITYV